MFARRHFWLLLLHKHCAAFPSAAKLPLALAMARNASSASAAATEHTASAAATEHSNETPFSELLNHESGQTGAYELKAIRTEIVDYSYPWQQKQVATQKLQVLFQSPARYSDLSMMAGPEQTDIRTSKSWSRAYRYWHGMCISGFAGSLLPIANAPKPMYTKVFVLCMSRMPSTFWKLLMQDCKGCSSDGRIFSPRLTFSPRHLTLMILICT